MSLLKRTSRNLGIMAVLRMISVFLEALTSIVLARLLIPEHFGIVALAMLVYMSMDSLAEFGLGAAVIQRKKDIEDAMNTAFTVRVILSIVLFVIFIVLAPLWAAFFGSPEVTHVMWFIAITMIVANLGFGPRVMLQKDLKFAKMAVPEISRHLTNTAVAITLALLGLRYWAIAAGIVASTFAYIAALNAVYPVRLRLRFDRAVARELLHFGKYVLGSSLLIFAIVNLDDAFAGKAFGITMLGFYVMAWRWANLPATHITHVFERVMFPTYSRIQDDRKRLSTGFVMALKYVSMLTVPAALGLMIIAPYFTRFVLGENWAPAALAMQILCWYGLVRSLSANCGSVFKAVGRPDILFKLSAASLISKVSLFFVFLPWGIEGIAFVMASTSAVICVANLHFAAKLTGTPASAVSGALLAPFGASLAMLGLIALIIITGVMPVTGIVALLILVGLAVAVYFASVYALDHKGIKELWTMMDLKGMMRGK